ncbi:toxic anion resistance protein [Carnobacterium funditum]|uniref:toxic anion resistance protein n=1 Tax=Carnobacterium funditum TaxID=2752 RepID=UPI000552016A|nr:toxic anion resistance protein [Carnobacterium funditum]
MTDNTSTNNSSFKQVNSELDELLSNPFDEANLNTPSVKESVEKDMVETQKVDRLINRLSEERQKQARELADQIDVTNIQSVMSYGAAAQQKLGEFSHTMLNQVQNQDTGEIGDSLNDLMFRLNEANPEDLRAEDNNVFKKIFGRVKKSIYEMTSKYQKIGAQIDKISIKLDKEKNGLVNDNIMLEQLYQKNKDYFDALNIYIAAGELKIDELANTFIPEAIQNAENSSNQMDVQIVNDLNQFLDRLEKRTYDLKLARQMTIQQAPQIRLIQNTNQALAEKIQSSINTAIPLWKNQIAIALTLLRQKDAVTAQRQVSETTNDLLKKNSEMLKISTIETAKENERGIIDIETLQKTQNDLVETLQETLQIQKTGRLKRKEAENELTVMEDSLKNKLLELTSDQS